MADALSDWPKHFDDAQTPMGEQRLVYQSGSLYFVLLSGERILVSYQASSSVSINDCSRSEHSLGVACWTQAIFADSEMISGQIG